MPAILWIRAHNDITNPYRSISTSRHPDPSLICGRALHHLDAPASHPSTYPIRHPLLTSDLHIPLSHPTLPSSSFITLSQTDLSPTVLSHAIPTSKSGIVGVGLLRKRRPSLDPVVSLLSLTIYGMVPFSSGSKRTCKASHGFAGHPL